MSNRAAHLDSRPDRRSARAASLALALALALTAVGTALMMLRREALPDPVAVHWGPDGADGFMSWEGAVAMAAVIVLGVPLVLLGVALLLDRSARHLLAGTAAGVAAFTAAITYGSVLTQDGAGTAPSPGPWVALGAVVGVALAVLVIRIGTPVPPPLPEQPVALPADATVLDVPAGTRVAWVGRLPRWWLLPALLLVAAVAPTAYLAWTLDPYLWILPVALTVLSVVFATATVAVDRRGVRVRSLGGLVTFMQVPLERVTSAEATTVRPLRDFGGWGWRVGADGTRALVVTSGPAMRVHRHGQPDLVIGLADPEPAAAAVNTLVVQRQSASS